MTAREKGEKRQLPKKLSDRILLIVLGAFLVLGVSTVYVQFLQPEGHRENIDAIVQDCRSIISAAQRWYRSSSVVGGAQRRGWQDLDFVRLGMVDDQGGSPTSISNVNARYTIEVAVDGQSFDLIAEGRYGSTVVYRSVTEAPPPEPEVR